MKKVTVIGAGSWGTALAVLLAGNGNQVTLWGRKEDGIEETARTRVNARFLPGVSIPYEIEVTADLDFAMSQTEMLVLSVPSQALRSVLRRIEHRVGNDVVIVNTAKGLEIGTHLRMSEVVRDTWGPDIHKRFAVLSGPSHAEEVGRRIPTAVVAASSYLSVARQVQDVFMSRCFRVYTSDDVIGVEMGGSLKNIIALATGISEGLGFGDNTKAALLTRGLVEIIRMGVKVERGPDLLRPKRFGDLVVTATAVLAKRPCRFSYWPGHNREQVIEMIGMAVEGISTTKAAFEMSSELGLEMPITNIVYQVLLTMPGPAVWKLMERDKKDETLS